MIALLVALGAALPAGLAEASGGSYPADSLVMDPARQQRPELAALLANGREEGKSDEETLGSWVAKNRWQEGEPIDQVGHLDDLDATTLEDLLKQKRTSATPLPTIIARYGSQQAFQDVSWQLDKLFPTTYAGMRFRVGGDDRVRMFFKGAVPTEAVKLVGSLPEAVVLEGGNFVPSSQRQGLIDKSFVAAKSLVKQFAVSFDSERQSILVRISDSERSEVQDLTAAVAKVVDPVPVLIETGLTPIRDADSVMRGGGFLDWNVVASPHPICTAGFVVESDGSGALRLGTAGHCIKDTNALGFTSGTYGLQGVDGGDSGVVNNMWYVDSIGTPDLGYMSHGSFAPIGTFYYDPGVKRSVQGAASSRYEEGTSVCFFGRTTWDQASCGVVTIVSISYNQAGKTGLVQTSAPAQGGDSGGPWYRGNWAVGQTVGNDVGGTHSYYAPVFQYSDYGFHVLLY